VTVSHLKHLVSFVSIPYKKKNSSAKLHQEKGTEVFSQIIPVSTKNKLGSWKQLSSNPPTDEQSLQTKIKLSKENEKKSTNT
jgi:hypothetical protein